MSVVKGIRNARRINTRYREWGVEEVRTEMWYFTSYAGGWGHACLLSSSIGLPRVGNT